MALSRSDSASLRIRVDRLLRNDLRVEDLTSLFLAMRDQCEGRECVQEIGDFVAHRSTRTRGIITRSTRDFFATLRFIFPQPKPPLDLTNLPKNFPDLLSAAFRRTDSSQLRQQLGLKRAKAEKDLENLRKRLTLDHSNRLFLSWPTKEDIAMMRCILGHITAASAFDESRLFEEFKATLAANKLLDRSEMRSFESLRTIVGLYAISQMHLCIIDLGDGTHAELSAGATLSEGTIKVNATAELLDAKRILVAATFFDTAIDVKTYCDLELHPCSDQQPKWPYPIELTNQGRLGRMA